MIVVFEEDSTRWRVVDDDGHRAGRMRDDDMDPMKISSNTMRTLGIAPVNHETNLRSRKLLISSKQPHISRSD